MKILVTGIDGYIGTVLLPLLNSEGFDVTGLDTKYYDEEYLFPPEKTKDIRILRKDTRDITREDVEGFDAIVHMAELSNDPLGTLDESLTYDINHKASVALASVARDAGVSRFIYTSSCSIYGRAEKDIVDETSPVFPQTAYARCKLLVETDVAKLATDSFSPVFLRNATAYGASPRMRFDIVVNNLSGLAWTTGKIQLNSDGTAWRPLIHVRDFSLGIFTALKAPQEKIHNQIFNVGRNDANYQIRDLAEIIKNVFPECEITMSDNDRDTRSYRVSFDKIFATLPEFTPQWTVERGVRELKSVFESVRMTDERFLARNFTRLKEIQYLTSTNRLDNTLRWRNA
jgi:nucleoside-diphosphate-sugar epimerase